MKNIVVILSLLAILSVTAQNDGSTQMVSGTIVSASDGTPIPNAIITVAETFNEVQSNADGEYAIETQRSDSLVVEAFLRNPKTIDVPNESEKLDIELTTNSELLEEVLLREQEEQQFVQTNFGPKRTRAMGHSYDDNQELFISGADIDMYTVARKMPFLDVSGSVLQPAGVFSNRMRGLLPSSQTPMLVIVDGVPVSQNALAIIDPATVTNITLNRSLAGTIKFGSLGAGGVMNITTLNSIRSDSYSPRSLLAQGNDYNEQLPPISGTYKNVLQATWNTLNKATNAEEAVQIYKTKRLEKQHRNLGFYIDMSNYFSRWGKTYSYQVLADLYNQAKDNPRILRTIAFKLEERGQLFQAAYILERLVDKHPSTIQNYRDLARLYSLTRRYKLADVLYRQMISNTIPKLDFTSIRPILVHEFRNLIAKHKRKIAYQTIPNEFLSLDFKKDIRIVLEYTNALSEFKVQFVSPKKKFYTWSHTYFENRKLIEDELANGYAMKEFIIEDSDYGDWLVNIERTETTKSAVPTFLKYTIYKNYGLPSETKEVKVINLAENDQKMTLDTFLY